MTLIGSRSSFTEIVNTRPHRRCSECSNEIAVGAKYLAAIRFGKVQKIVCGEECRISFDDKYWQERASDREER